MNHGRTRDGGWDAAKIMWGQDCGCVPVIDPSGRVTGMITDRDICMSAYFRATALREIAIEDAMSVALTLSAVSRQRGSVDRHSSAARQGA
jgi:CBS domain-containing protein